MDSVETAPLMENEYVKELFALMEANHLSGRQDLSAVISQVAAMDEHLSAMTAELAAMRRELAEAQRRNHPVKNALQKATVTMRRQISELRESLADLKRDIIDGCKNALAAVRDKGLSALRDAAAFFKIHPGLEAVRDRLDGDIRRDEAAITRIEAMSGEYHEAERHVANMGRALIGAELAQAVKPAGKLEKAIKAPIKADHASLRAVRRCVDAAIGGLTRLENRSRRPPIMETVNKLNEQIEHSQRSASVIGRQNVSRAER